MRGWHDIVQHTLLQPPEVDICHFLVCWLRASAPSLDCEAVNLKKNVYELCGHLPSILVRGNGGFKLSVHT